MRKNWGWSHFNDSFDVLCFDLYLINILEGRKAEIQRYRDAAHTLCSSWHLDVYLLLLKISIYKEDIDLTGLFPGESAATVFNNKTELFERPKARVQGYLGY